MRIKKGFVVREIAGQSIVVALGGANKVFNGMIKLNETGAFLWEQLKKECTEDDLLAALRAEYDVSEDLAKADIAAFLNSLKEAALLA